MTGQALDAIGTNLAAVNSAAVLLSLTLVFTILYAVLTYHGTFKRFTGDSMGKLIVGVLLRTAAAGAGTFLVLFLVLTVIPETLLDTLFGWVPSELAPVLRFLPLLIVVADVVWHGYYKH